MNKLNLFIINENVFRVKNYFFKKKVFQEFSLRVVTNVFRWPNESLYSFLQCTRVAMKQYLCENEIVFLKGSKLKLRNYCLKS